MSDAWPDPAVDELKTLLLAGLSFSKIAKQLTASHGREFTRNSAIAKAHRLGLTGKSNGRASRAQLRARRPAPPRKAPRASREWAGMGLNQKPAPDLVAPPAVEELLPRAERFGILRRDEDGRIHADERLTLTKCRWPVEHEPSHPDFTFCCRDAVPGQPYCAGHAAKAVQPPRGRKDRVHEFTTEREKNDVGTKDMVDAR